MLTEVRQRLVDIRTHPDQGSGVIKMAKKSKKNKKGKK
jgi:hypothetical protein